jgi:hypothetical protein
MRHVGAPGLFPDIPADDYHADPAPEPSLSASIAHVLLSQSPEHAQFAHPRLNPNWKADEPSNEMDFGSAVHAILLEGTRGIERVQVIDAEDYRKVATRKQRDEARRAGLIPLLADKYIAAVNLAEAARERLNRTELRGILEDGGDAEITAVWQEQKDDFRPLPVWCRARLDYLSADRRLILDVKTRNASAQPDAFVRAIVSEGMDVQAAMYRRGVRAITGVDPKFCFCVVETAPPYGLSLVGLTPAAMDLADRKARWAMDVWARCVATGTWPGYPERVCWTDFPPWVEAQWMEMELRQP